MPDLVRCTQDCVTGRSQFVRPQSPVSEHLTNSTGVPRELYHLPSFSPPIHHHLKRWMDGGEEEEYKGDHMKHKSPPSPVCISGSDVIICQIC